MKFEFEQIDNSTTRAKVYGGWLVKTYEDVMTNFDNRKDTGYEWRVAMAFVPDAKHEWEI